MKKVSKHNWDISFNKWYESVGFAIDKSKDRTSYQCGYCLEAPVPNPRCVCPLAPVVCGGTYRKRSIWAKWHHETCKTTPRWKLALRWSRQILQAIIDDGRKHGYVGEKEEKMIEEVM
jgi:hypothetical protein